MSIIEFENLLKISIYFILGCHSIPVLLIFKNRDLLNFNPIKKIGNGIIWLFGLGLIEIMLMDFILVKKFIYSKQIFSFLNAHGINDFNFTSPISYLLKFFFFGLFFINVFQSKRYNLIFKLTTIGLLVFEFIMIFKFKNYQYYDSLSSTVKNIFILTGSGLLFFKIYKADISNISLYKNTYFWIAFALFITAITELFFEFIFTKLHESDLAGFYKLYLVRNAFQVMFFILMIVGFLNAKYLRFLPDKY